MSARIFIAVALFACGRVGFDPPDDGGARPDLPGPIGNRAFVTSSVQAPASLGGLAGADTICADRAREAGLPGRFVAFLSISTMHVRDRLIGARGWYRTDGEPIADTVDDLVGLRVLMPIALDENGVDYREDLTFVTTGSYQGMTNLTCSDYTDPAGFAAAGHTFYAAGGWSNTDEIPCSMPTRLYCFQTEYDLPLTYSRATGRTAFVSTASFSPSSGIAAADAICTSEAQGARLPGTYLALLPDLVPAAQRFNSAGAPWVRTDGIALAPTPTDVLVSQMRAPLCVRADGTFGSGYVITGASSPTAAYDPRVDCDGWTNPNGGNEYGHASGVGGVTFAQTTSECMTPQPVYCLER